MTVPSPSRPRGATPTPMLSLALLVAAPALAAPDPGLGPGAIVALRGPEDTVELPLTLPDGTASVALLTRFEVLTPDATLLELTDAGERPMPRPDLVLRKGRLAASPESLVFVAASREEAWGSIRLPGATYAIAPHGDGRSSLVDVAAAPRRARPRCGVEDSGGSMGTPRPTDLPPLDPDAPRQRLEAEIAIDVDNNLYTYFGGSSGASAYVLSLMAQCSAYYERDVDVQFAVPFLRVWSTADPYTSTSSSGALSQFVSYWRANMGGVQRDLAHLMSRQNFGGIAYLDVLCSNAYGYGVSGVQANYSYPNGGYTWDADVVSHEIGHNFGSPHTHCYNPPVDRCYNQESGCYSGAVVPQIGTIMSYCHLVMGKTLNFSPQEQAVVLAGATSASCLTPPTGGCTALAITPPSLPPGLTGIPYSQTLTASGGTAPYTFVSLNLPSWLTLTAAGPDTATLAGTPPAAGSYAFDVDVVDSTKCGGTEAYVLTVADPPCTDDAYEPNDTFATARSLTTGSLSYSLSYCDDQDYFGMALLAGEGLTATITFVPSQGNLDLELLDPAGGSLGSSTGTGGTEVVSLPAAASSGTYVMRVFAAGGTDVRSYTLTTVHTGGPPAARTLAGPGPAAGNANRVRAFDDAGVLRTELTAFSAGSWGTNVGGGDIDADGVDEILAGPGPGAVFGPQVRGFESTTAAMGKVNFYAYGTLRFGVKARGADLDADAIHEILTTPGPGAVFGPHVRGFDFDAVAVATMPNVNYFAYGTLKFGANAGSGRLVAGGNEEILTGPGPGAPFAPTVRGWTVLPGQVAAIAKINFNPTASTHGATVAGAELDADGFDEILVGLGPAPASPATLHGFDFDGTAVAAVPGGSITAFAGATHGAWVGAGDWTADGDTEAVVGPGPDPAQASRLRAFAHSGSAFVLVPASDIVAFPGLAYGATVSGGVMP